MIQKNPTLPAIHEAWLESGDRLTRDEFHRRYERAPEIKRAELVEGVVYVSSPVRQEYHGRQHSFLQTWLGYYQAYTPGVDIGDNSTIILDGDNEYQPDGFLRIDAKLGGKSSIDPDKYIGGPPEFAAEIAASSASYDLGPKMNAYRRSGVEEYLVWRVLDEAIDWFRLHEGCFVARPVDENGWHRSEVFPGLWLDKAALLAGEMRRVLDVLKQGLETAEHERFVERLKRGSA